MSVMAIRLMPERKCVGCKQQAEWGCEAVQFRDPPNEYAQAEEYWHKPAHLPVELDGAETYACPRQDLNQNDGFYTQLLNYYGMYQKGFLPERGAVIDQSNILIELFRIVDNVNSECDDAIEIERAERRAEQQRRSRGEF